MRKNIANGARRSAAPRKVAVRDPALQDLLDHLGRLLAREYVALITKGTMNDNREGPEERTHS